MPQRSFDVAVVGARVAGAAIAMLLARAGLRVLLVDRARFPSDTLSSHQVQLPGVARLQRWGLLDRLGAAPTHRMRFDVGDAVLTGAFPTHDGVGALYSPRRTVLDALLIDAAAAAGVCVRTRFDVSGVLQEGGRVVGIRGRTRGGSGGSGGSGSSGHSGSSGGEVIDRAALVIGADGKRSLIASAVGARRIRHQPTLSMACYSYWSDLPITTGELYQRPEAAAAVLPTNDGLTMAYVAVPLRRLDEFRTDTSAAFHDTISSCGDLGDRVHAATRAERFRLAPDQPNFIATSYGPGWALVGDAGYSLDSITAQGISNALRAAEGLADAVIAARVAGQPLDARLRNYQRDRDAYARPMYDFTVGLAAFRPRSGAETALFKTIEQRPAEVSRFLGVFAGAEPLPRYFGVRNMIRLIGVRATARAAVSRLRRPPLPHDRRPY